MTRARLRSAARVLGRSFRIGRWAALVIVLLYAGAVARAQITPCLLSDLLSRSSAVATLIVAGVWAQSALSRRSLSEVGGTTEVRVIVTEPTHRPRVIRLSPGRHIVGADPAAGVHLLGEAAARREALIEVIPPAKVRVLGIATGPRANGSDQPLSNPWIELLQDRPVEFDGLVLEAIRE